MEWHLTIGRLHYRYIYWQCYCNFIYNFRVVKLIVFIDSEVLYLSIERIT